VTSRGPQQPVECARLTAALRELRTATGLSLAALADLTPYSKSSWERYLNGKTLPPRHAVEALCALAGERPEHALALWQLAEPVWTRRTDRPRTTSEQERQEAGPHVPGPHEAGPQEPKTPPASGRRASGGLVIGIVAGLATVAAGLALSTWDFTPAHSDPAPHRTAAPALACHGDACTGKDSEDTDCSTAAHPPAELGEHRFAGGTVVKVRRSERCGTVWARIDRGRVGDRVEIVSPRPARGQAEVQDRFDAEASLSTPMAAADEEELPRVRACLVRATERQCFRARAPGGT
jgi:transcriptional regulator with XRE-family HTH domain